MSCHLADYWHLETAYSNSDKTITRGAVAWARHLPCPAGSRAFDEFVQDIFADDFFPPLALAYRRACSRQISSKAAPMNASRCGTI
jgi:hypothetical protein